MESLCKLKSEILSKLYLFMAVLGFCCAGLSLVSASRGSSLVVICRLLIAVASLLRAWAQGMWAQWLCLLGS